jgi:general secretion pathway protein I
MLSMRRDPGLRRDDGSSDARSGSVIRERGFTLLEILVAFVVIGVLGGAMLQLFQGSLRNVALSAEYTEAALLARSRLAEFEARGVLEAAVEEGEAGQGYRWRAEIVPYFSEQGAEPVQEPAPEALLEAFRLTLTMSWGDDPDARDYVVETVLLNPAQVETPR